MASEKSYTDRGESWSKFLEDTLDMARRQFDGHLRANEMLPSERQSFINGYMRTAIQIARRKQNET